MMFSVVMLSQNNINTNNVDDDDDDWLFQADACRARLPRATNANRNPSNAWFPCDLNGLKASANCIRGMRRFSVLSLGDRKSLMWSSYPDQIQPLRVS